MHKIAALKSTTAAIAVCALEVRPGDVRQRLIPAGTFDAPRGAMAGQGPWHIDAATAPQVIARSANRATELVIDYEHQTLLADQNGKANPAAGWINPQSLEWREDGLYGAVSWTARAGQMINDREYRYLSPVFAYDPSSGAVLELMHVALTNTPAIDDDAITARAAARMDITTQSHQEDDSVKKEQLIKLLGLQADATDEQISTALAALKAGADEYAALRKDLGLQEDADAGEAVAALKAKAEQTKPDPAKFVPVEVLRETQQQLAALKQDTNQAEMDQLIEEGLKDGRIAGKATADYLRGQGLAALKAHLEDAPSIAALRGETQTAGKKPEGDEDAELTKEELAVCKNMGISPEKYKEQKKALAQQAQA